MTRHEVPLLPKQTPEELQELKRQDAEDEFHHANSVAIRNASQPFANEPVVPYNHLGHGQQFYVDPTANGQMQVHQMQQMQEAHQWQQQQQQHMPQMPQNGYNMAHQDQDQSNWGDCNSNQMFEQQPQQQQQNFQQQNFQQQNFQQQNIQQRFQQPQYGDNSHGLGTFSVDGSLPVSQNDLDMPLSPTSMPQQMQPFQQPIQTVQYGQQYQHVNQRPLPSIDNVHQRNPVPVTTTAHDGPFRRFTDHIVQQPLPNNTAFSQLGQALSVSEGNASHSQGSTSPDGKVAINPLPQPRSSQALAPNPDLKPPANMGPMSAVRSVPPRPKPGRKPLPQEDAQDRRRVQNRVAQRNFRDKRAQKVSELTLDNERIRKEADDQYKMLINKCNDQKERANSLMLENEQLKADLQAAIKRAETAERRVHGLDVANRFADSGFQVRLQKSGTSTAMPPMPASLTGPVDEHLRASGSVITPSFQGGNNAGNNNGYDDTEIDMNAVWKSSRQTSNPVQNKFESDTQTWLSGSMDVDRQEDNCGFCTDESNCACIQSQIQKPVIAPGGCDACVADPERAAACRALASQTEVSQRPTESTNTNNGGIEQRNDSMAAPPGMMSCSNLIDRLGPTQRMPSIAELFPGKFHSYPGITGSGYDVNEQEAAQVLQSMSRRNTVPGTPSRADL